MALQLPTELWFCILSYDEPINHWTTMRGVCKQLQSIVEADFESRHYSDFQTLAIGFDTNTIPTAKKPFLCSDDAAKSGKTRIDFNFARFAGSPGKGQRRLACLRADAKSFGRDRISKLLHKLDQDTAHVEMYNRTLADMHRCEASMERTSGHINPQDLFGTPSSSSSPPPQEYILKTEYYILGPERLFLSHSRVPVPGLQVHLPSSTILVDWKPLYACVISEKRRLDRERKDMLAPQVRQRSREFEILRTPLSLPRGMLPAAQLFVEV